MDHGSLKEAIRRRRGQSIDLKIMIAPSEEGIPEEGMGDDMALGGEEPEEKKMLDLAPEVTDREEGKDDLLAPEEGLLEDSSQPGLDDSDEMGDMEGMGTLHKKAKAYHAAKKLKKV